MNTDSAKIFSQLQAIAGKYEELSIRITLPEVIDDNELFRKLMQEHSDLSELAEFARSYIELTNEIEDVKEMASSDEPDIAMMAREELGELNQKLESMNEEAVIRLLPRDPDDRRNAIIEIRAGAGGDEAGLFAAELLRMYAHYAASRGWKTEMIQGGDGTQRVKNSVIGSVYGSAVFAAGNIFLCRVQILFRSFEAVFGKLPYAAFHKTIPSLSTF